MAEQLGGVEFSVTVDSSSAVTASTAVVNANDKVRDSFEKVEAATKRLPSSLSRLGNSYSSANGKLTEFVAQQIEAGRRIDASGNVVTAYGVKARALTSELSKLNLEHENAKEKVNAVSAAMQSLTQETTQSNTKVVEQVSKVDKLNTELSTASGEYSALAAGIRETSAAQDKANSVLANAIARQISMGNTVNKNNQVIDKNGNEITQATTALQRYAQESAEANKRMAATTEAFDRISRSAGGGRKNFRAMNGAIGQLGYQVQDVAVQLQMGTNALMVFGQQGSQVASLFGPGGAVVGAVLAVAAAIGTSLVPSLKEAEGEFAGLPDNIIKRLEALQKKLQETDQASISSVAQVEIAKLNKEYDQLISNAEALEKEALDTATAYNGSAQQAARLAGQAKQAREEAADLAIAIGRFTEQTLKAREGWSGVAEEEDKSAKLVDENNSKVVTLAQNLAVAEAALSENTAEATRLQAAFQFGVSTFEQLPESAQTMVNRLIAVREQQKLMSDEKLAQIKAENEAQQASGQRGSNIERMRQEFMSEQQLKAEKFLKDGEILRTALENEELTKAEFDLLEKDRVASHQQWLVQQTQDATDKRTQIEKRHQDAVQSFRNAAIQNAGNLLQQFSGESKAAAIAAIAINKGLALAQNTQNTLVAQTRALAELGPIAGPPVAAKIGMYGAVNGALIAATGLAQAATLGSGGGGSRGSDISSTSTQPSQAQVQEPQRQIVDVRVTGQGGGIVDMFNFEVANGAQPITTGG